MHRYRWARLAVGLGAALLALQMGFAGGATPALAQTEAELKAREEYRLGDEAFRGGRYAEALPHFQKGYELSGRPRFLLNIAHSQRLMGDGRAALATYKKFLETDPRPDDKALAEQAVAELEAEFPSEPAPQPPPVVEQPPPVVVEAAPAPVVVSEAAKPSEDEAKPFYSRWYFWAGVAAVVAAGVIVGVAVSGDEEPAMYRDVGSWGRADL